MRSRKFSVFVIILVLLSVLACCCIASATFAGIAQTGDNLFRTTIVDSGNQTETVAIIKVEGVITSQAAVDIWGNETPDMASEIIKKIDKAEQDDNVKAILLEVNSPGGEAYASKLIYNRLVEFKESGKTLVVLMKDTAASGGYFVSAPADEIVASTITTTGSIGVLVNGTDFSELYKKIGITEYTVINTNGELKVLDGLENKDSEAYKVLQGILDDVYDDFVDAVAKGRHKTKEEIIAVADGRVYSGKQAKELGLVDTLGEVSTAKAKVKELANLADPNFVIYEDKNNPLSLYSLSLKRVLFPELAAVESKKPGISIQYLMKI